MKPEAQRKAIAKACRWPIHQGGKYVSLPIGESISQLVDPLNDLNAMHEAEKALDGDQWNTYCHFVDTCSRNGDARLPFRVMNPSYVVDAYLIHAEAEHKAEAFLRTLNLWTE